MDVKCLDTYALVEISKGNLNFISYLSLETTIPNLIMAEFYAVILREHDEKTADYWFKEFERFIIPVNMEILIKAVKYRQENKKQNLSFFDCIGYIFALENNMKFVTGDKEFKDKPNVEWIK